LQCFDVNDVPVHGIRKRVSQELQQQKITYLRYSGQAGDAVARILFIARSIIMVVPARRFRRKGIPKPRAIQLRIVKLLWMVGRRMRSKLIFVFRAESHNICEGKGSGIFVSGDESRPPPPRARARTYRARSIVRRSAHSERRLRTTWSIADINEGVGLFRQHSSDV
jgi:hypothetical protein